MTIEEARSMNDAQAKAHAERVYKCMEGSPTMKLLIDLVKEERNRNPANAGALDQWFMITSDIMGLHVERFEHLNSNP